MVECAQNIVHICHQYLGAADPFPSKSSGASSMASAATEKFRDCRIGERARMRPVDDGFDTGIRQVTDLA
jgi:hypothetical protein